jgi:hypothetical protein
MAFLKESVERRRARIDYAGAALFSVAVVSLLVILTETDAGAATLGALAALFVVSGALFVLQERRTPHPIISIALWSRRLIATSNAATLLAGMALIGLTTVLPIYVRACWPLADRRRLHPVDAGARLAAGGDVLAQPLSAFRHPSDAARGQPDVPVGALLLLLLGPDSSPVLAAVGSFLMGVAMGLISITSIALVQESVEWSMRGSATASIIFARSLGNTLGATALGAVLNLGIAHYASGPLAARCTRRSTSPRGSRTSPPPRPSAWSSTRRCA